MTEYRYQRPNYLSRFLIFIGIFLVIGMLLVFISALIAPSLSKDPLMVEKLTQMMASLGMFFVTAWVFLISFRESPALYWKMKQRPAVSPLAKAIVLVLCLNIIGMMLIWLNRQIPLGSGEFGKWVAESEDKRNSILESFLNMKGTFDLLVNLVLIAVIPALCEEIFFRGTMQRLLYQWTRNPHIAIWVTSLLFAFIHFEFTKVIPIFVDSLFLGYLFYYTGNIWYNIIAHFINNGAIVLLFYFGRNSASVQDIASDTYVPPLWLGIAAILVAAGIMYSLYRKRVSDSPDDTYHTAENDHE